MKRCNYCSRYAIGQPTFCSHCGRSYNVRYCSRGHVLSRYAHFCSTCGSHDLSTPAPPESLLMLLSRLTLQVVVAGFVVLLVVTVVVSVMESIDWSWLIGPVVWLLVMFGLLYWLTSLLPGPVRKVGRMLGHLLMRILRGGRKGHQSGHGHDAEH
jgi:hypothetical protein